MNSDGLSALTPFKRLAAWSRSARGLARPHVILLLGTLALTSSAHAAEVYLSGNPATWRLQNYQGAGAGVTLWWTGSTCGSGQLFLANPTEQEKNRLWALILAAKLANRNVFVYYETTNCQISSFGTDN